MSYEEFDEWLTKIKMLADRIADIDDAVIDAYSDFFLELYEEGTVGPRRAVDLFIERYI